MSIPFRWSCGWLLIACALAVSGCRPNTATGDVSGRVTYQGQPLPAGRVTFFGDDGRVANGQINPDGTYHIQGVPTGPVTIAVNSRPSSPVVFGQGPKMGQAVGPPAKHVPIPERYQDPGQSGLTYTVRSGEQEYHIELQSASARLSGW